MRIRTLAAALAAASIVACAQPLAPSARSADTVRAADDAPPPPPADTTTDNRGGQAMGSGN